MCVSFQGCGEVAQAFDPRVTASSGWPFYKATRYQNVMLVGMASEISENYTYKCVDRSRHNGIKGAMAKCAH